MATPVDQEFGNTITRLIRKESLSREDTREAFCCLLRNETTEMQQGAFLAALTAKGETEEEAAGVWDAIYELDTEKVDLNVSSPVVENSGTGMDTFKTFNISTAASLIAASDGIVMARHGARAITSVCGTVDMAEALGVDVECSAAHVAESIAETGIGLFNGMSTQIHPKALGRILSRICFGSTLNIAASLANPALPKRGVRGVYSREMLLPVIGVMKAIGYEKAVAVYGGIDGSDQGMDEASVCGITYGAALDEDGDIREFTLRPEDYGVKLHSPDDLMPNADLGREARAFVSLVQGEGHPARQDAAILNAGLIYHVAGRAEAVSDGIDMAADALRAGRAYQCLESWVAAQNRNPEKGLETLRSNL